MAVQHDTVNYQPPRQLVAFEQQFAPLMMFLADKGDCIIANTPDEKMLSYWSDKGIAIPEFISPQEAKKRIAHGEEFCPWGWSREVIYRMGGRAMADKFTPAHRMLFSRQSSVLLERFLAQMDLPQWCQVADCAQLVDSTEELTRRVNAAPCVIKSLWSASGRGVSLVNQTQFRNAAICRYSTSIRNDGAVVVEPFLNRKVDFAMLLWIGKSGEVKYIGKNFYRSDEAGRFGIELIGCNPVVRYVENGSLPPDWETISANALQHAIRQMNWHLLYNGPVGVDSMLYADDAGNVRIRLCVEVNIRYTMGNVNQRVAQCFNGQQLEWTLGGENLITFVHND